MSKHSWRLNRIVRPGLQMHLTLTFLGLSAMALVFQFGLFQMIVTGIAAELGSESGRALDELGHGMLQAVLWSLAVVLPLTLVVGVLVTFKVAGPIHRFQSFLTDVAEGRATSECRIRKGDLLQDFCHELNRATRPLWEAQGSSSSEDGAPVAGTSSEESGAGSAPDAADERAA